MKPSSTKASNATKSSSARSAAPAPGQRVNEFWPELDVFVPIDERSRLVLLGPFARGREYASATEATLGIHYDRFARPMPDWWREAVPPRTGCSAQSLGSPLAELGVASFTPYAMLEWFWDSRPADWYRRYQQYGVEVELRGRLGAELYVGIQDQARTASSRVVAIGTAPVVRY